MTDTSWLDETLNSPEQKSEELNKLVDLAKNIGLYEYNYTEEAVNDPNLPADDKDHIGIMAQQLLKIPGLASAVSTTTDENGNETYVVDGNKVALAALGYIAALSKIVLDIRGVDYNNENTSTVNVDQLPLGTAEADGTNQTGDSTATASGTEGNNIERSAMETTDSTELDGSATGLNSNVYKVMKE